MAMVNMNNLLNGKDSRWLQLEVCREFQRNKCSRPDTECKFAHPPANVEVQNGRVTACYDSIKGRCNREKPPCKYFHPPQHLKDQLLINGRNHLALKNALMQQMGLTPGQALVPGQVQAVATNPYLTGMPQVGSTYSPYFAPGPIIPPIVGPDPTGVASQLGVVPQTVVTAQQKMPRSDRLEMDMKSVGSFYYENFAFPGMVPYKRPAADKSGVPVYQPNANTYQQLMQLQQPFVPVSCEYSTSPTPAAASSPVTSLPPPTPNPSDPPPSTATSTATNASFNPALTSVVTFKKEPELISPASAAAPNQQPQSQSLPTAAHHDPAALAKEVAQQNYAKAVKLAAATQAQQAQAIAQAQAQYAASYATQYATPLALNPINYTGIALNKQALAAVPQVARYPSSMQIQGFATAAAPQTHFGLTNPYANFLNLARPPTPQATIINPYSLVRTSYPTTPAPTLVANGLMSAQAYQAAAAAAQVASAPMPPAVSTSSAVAATNNNNNNVVMQPYKKLKTT